jgi:DNA-binding HxlR family transcriptional regulator
MSTPTKKRPARGAARRRTRRRHDPTAQAMEVLGDRWSLLVVSAVSRGVCRFGQLQRELGIARTVLAARLQVLVGHGILTRRRYHTNPDWYEYRLTSEGRALEPVIQALSDWSRTHFPAGRG